MWILGKWEPSWKPGDPARQEGERREVGIRQWRRIDVLGCLKIQETGSSQHQATFMHRVSVIVHCVIITTQTTITGIVFYCIFCFRKINHLVVKHHLHSSSDVREVVSSTGTVLFFFTEGCPLRGSRGNTKRVSSPQKTIKEKSYNS